MQKTTSIVVSDILGKPIYESTNTLKKGVNNISVNLNNPKNGVYILKTEVDGESLHLKLQ